MLESASGRPFPAIRRTMSQRVPATSWSRARGDSSEAPSAKPCVGSGPWRTLLLRAVSAILVTLPIISLAQVGLVLRPADRPSLLDDGDIDSLRTAVAQSLSWLDRQPPGRVLTFGPRRITLGEYASGLRRLLMMLAGDPAPEVLEERVLAEFDVLS